MSDEKHELGFKLQRFVCKCVPDEFKDGFGRNLANGGTRTSLIIRGKDSHRCLTRHSVDDKKLCVCHGSPAVDFKVFDVLHVSCFCINLFPFTLCLAVTGSARTPRSMRQLADVVDNATDFF